MIKHEVGRARVFEKQGSVGEQTVDFRSTRSLRNLQVLTPTDHIPAVPCGSPRIPNARVREVHVRRSSRNDVQFRMIEKAGVWYPTCEISIPGIHLERRGGHRALSFLSSPFCCVTKIGYVERSIVCQAPVRA